MREVYLGESPLRPIPEPWEMPDELIIRQVDKVTGKLATEWCPQDRAYTEVYIPGTEPTEARDADGSPALFGVPLRGLRELAPPEPALGETRPPDSAAAIEPV